MTAHDLTPVQRAAGLCFKRDDLYVPFGAGGVNGGKLRQCMMLVEAARQRNPGLRGVVSYCSIHSPQAPITAAVSRHFGLPCTIIYGGTSKAGLARERMPRLALYYGATIQIAAATGRHNVLKAKADALAGSKGYFVVQYGINLDEYGEVLLGAVSEQVQNIPDGLDDLYITCGSGITSSGILIGLERYHKDVKHVHLIATAFDRQAKVRETLKRFGVNRDFTYHDMFHTKGFAYEKREPLAIRGIHLHPQYEAKTVRYIAEHHLNTRNALMWIVGAEPDYR